MLGMRKNADKMMMIIFNINGMLNSSVVRFILQSMAYWWNLQIPYGIIYFSGWIFPLVVWIGVHNYKLRYS